MNLFLVIGVLRSCIYNLTINQHCAWVPWLNALPSNKLKEDNSLFTSDNCQHQAIFLRVFHIVYESKRWAFVQPESISLVELWIDCHIKFFIWNEWMTITWMLCKWSHNWTRLSKILNLEVCSRLVCKLETEGSKGRALPPGYVQISLLHRMHLHLTSPILHHHLLCTLRDPPAYLSFLGPKKKSNHNHHGPCFLFLQDHPFFLFSFFFCNSQRKTKLIYRKSLAPSTPVRNRLLLSSRNRGTSLASSLRIDESFRRGI